MGKVLILTESDRNDIRKMYGLLNEGEIPYPSGISKEVVDKILSISAQNKKNLKGSYLFPTQQQDIDKQFGAGTYDKFWIGGGRDVLDGKSTFPGMKPTGKPTTTQKTKIPEIPYPSGVSKEAVDKIKSISAQNKKNLQGSYLFPPQQQDIDKQFGAGTYDKFWKGGGRDVLDGRKTFVGAQTPTSTTTNTNNAELRQKNINYIYCSVRKNIITAKGSQEGVKWDNYVNTYKLTLDEIEIARKACASQPVSEYPEKSSNVGGSKTGTSTKTKTVTPPPEFLKNTEGVKAFQDWLDTNKKGWYKGGELNKGRGYGSFGSNTTKAWNAHQNAYIESKNLKKVGGVERPGSLTPSSTGTPSITSRPAPNLQPNVTGDQIYKTLYDGGNIEGAGQNRIKVKIGMTLPNETLTKLDDYLSTLGYNRIKQETEKTYGSKYVWSK